MLSDRHRFRYRAPRFRRLTTVDNTPAARSRRSALVGCCISLSASLFFFHGGSRPVRLRFAPTSLSLIVSPPLSPLSNPQRAASGRLRRAAVLLRHLRDNRPSRGQAARVVYGGEIPDRAVASSAITCRWEWRWGSRHRSGWAESRRSVPVELPRPSRTYRFHDAERLKLRCLSRIDPQR